MLRILLDKDRNEFVGEIAYHLDLEKTTSLVILFPQSDSHRRHERSPLVL